MNQVYSLLNPNVVISVIDPMMEGFSVNIHQNRSLHPFPTYFQLIIRHNQYFEILKILDIFRDDG